MEHPLIGDISDKSEDELRNTISSLYSKLNVATRSGNGNLCQQIRMALETYNRAYQNKIADRNAKLEDKGSLHFDKIKVE
jgi:hypothetical protein